MTVTVTTPAGQISVASSASIAASPVTANVGDMLVVIVGADNNEASGGSSIASVTDAQGNVYTLAATQNQDPGAAAAGATVAFFVSTIKTALSAENITSNFSPNTLYKSMVVYRVQRTAANDAYSLVVMPHPSGVVPGDVGNGASINVIHSEMRTGDVFCAAAAIETDDTITGDSDTTNGSWSAIDTRLSDGGADAVTMTLSSQYKICTAAGSQSWDITLGAGRDAAFTGIGIREVPNVRLNMPTMKPPRR